MMLDSQLLLIALLSVAAICFVVKARRDRIAFREKFPPISDAEFLDRCSPGTNPEVALKVRRAVSEMFAVEYERVYPSTNFVEDLNAD